MTLFVAFSGGKDSTEMAYGLRDAGEEFELLFTPTGNELPELQEHIRRVVQDLNVGLVIPPMIPEGGLLGLIEELQALPNWRQRWCTRMLKIVPCIAYLKAYPGATLAVGLRADEEDREGLYGPYAKYRYPLRERGMDQQKVWASLRNRGISIPARTDCALCYGQRLYEWHNLWRDYPEKYREGEDLEERMGHTFRSSGRDTWPASLRDLRELFEKGKVPRKRRLHVEQESCRVCRG